MRNQEGCRDLLIPWRPFYRMICLLVSLGLPVAAPADGYPVSGFIHPDRDAVLTASVAGIIDAIHFKPGDRVAQGDVVIELDRKLEEIEVRRRQIVIENLKKELERTRELFGRTRSVSQEELDQKAAELEIAGADLELAREQLERRRIRAPFAGVVTDVFDLEPGEGCQVQTPLIRIIDTARCRLEVHAPPRHAASLTQGDSVSLMVTDGVTENGVSGIVSFIAPIIDPASGLLEVHVEFDNRTVGVRPGTLGRVQLVHEE